MDLIKLYDVLQNIEDFESREKGATSKEISEIENTLNVKLPNEYIEFLKKFGYVWSTDIEFFGVSDNQDEDVIYQTTRARAEKLPKDFLELPLDGVVIREYGGGGFYFLYSQDSPRSGEVSLILDETFYHEANKWDSFNDYLKFILKISADISEIKF